MSRLECFRGAECYMEFKKNKIESEIWLNYVQKRCACGLNGGWARWCLKVTSNLTLYLYYEKKFCLPGCQRLWVIMNYEIFTDH